MSFKPMTMADSFVVVSTVDPAIDAEKSNLEKYNSDWLKKPSEAREAIVPKTGEQLCEFVVGVVPPSEISRIGDTYTAGWQQRCWEYFVWGLRDIKNWPGEVPKKKRGDVEYVDPAWIGKTFVRGLFGVACEIGMRVMLFNRFTEDEAKN